MYTSFYNQSERGGGAPPMSMTSKAKPFKPMLAASSDHNIYQPFDAILYLNQRLHNDKMIVSDSYHNVLSKGKTHSFRDFVHSVPRGFPVRLYDKADR